MNRIMQKCVFGARLSIQVSKGPDQTDHAYVNLGQVLLQTYYLCEVALNPFMPGGLFYLNTLDWFIVNLRSFWSVFSITIYYGNSCM